MRTTLMVMLAAAAFGGSASAADSTGGITRVVTVDHGVSMDTPIGDARFRAKHAQAQRGDRDAMFDVAAMLGAGSGVERDERAMVYWLRQASQRNHPLASYQLYRHYLERGLDRDAVMYEALAIRQGYVIPPRLDPRRG
jgi:TPR repeat protein